MRKTILIALCAVLAVLVMPAASADASVASGNYHGCYKIEKKGNYNDVQAGVTVTQSGSGVRVYGYVAVTRACQKVNSIPVTRLSMFHARLKTASGRVIALSGGNSSSTKGTVGEKTRFVPTKCGEKLIASAQISYKYYDGSYVHRFYVHGPTFTRC